MPEFTNQLNPLRNACPKQCVAFPFPSQNRVSAGFHALHQWMEAAVPNWTSWTRQWMHSANSCCPAKFPTDHLQMCHKRVFGRHHSQQFGLLPWWTVSEWILRLKILLIIFLIYKPDCRLFSGVPSFSSPFWCSFVLDELLLPFLLLLTDFPKKYKK